MKTKGKFGVFGVMIAAAFGALGLGGSSNTKTIKRGPSESLRLEPENVNFRPAPRSYGRGQKPRDMSRIPKRYRLKTLRQPFNTPGYGSWLLDLCREQNINKFAERFGGKANPNNA